MQLISPSQFRQLLEFRRDVVNIRLEVSRPQEVSDPPRVAPLPIWPVLTWLGVAVGALLRFIHITRESLWFDEGYTAWMITNPAKEIVRLVRADTAPPLYYVCLHAWTALFGHSELGIRSLSAVSSVLTLVITVSLAKRFLRAPIAVAAVVWALALGFYQQFYAQEARFYALMAFLTVAMLQCLQKHLAATHRWWLIPLTLAVAASLYTHNMMMPYVAALAPVWLVLPSVHSLKRRLIDGAIVAAAAGILYAPWAITSLPAQLAFVHEGFWLDHLSPGAVFDLAIWLISVPANWFWVNLFDVAHVYLHPGFWPGYLGCAIFIAMMALALGFQKGADQKDALGLFLFVLLPPALVLVHSLISTPLLMNKVFLGSAAAMPLLLFQPLRMRLNRPTRNAARLATAIVLLFCVGTLANNFANDHKEDWRGAARYVLGLPPRHRLIVFLADDSQLPFDYYHGPYRSDEDRTGSPADFFDRNPPRAMLRVLKPEDLQHLESVINSTNYDEILLVESHQQYNDPLNLTLKYLLGRFPNPAREDLYDVSVWSFQTNKTAYAVFNLMKESLMGNEY
ncbi:MAG: glycosyltransferase family 39 protein [Planctomycetota bacterium]|nr:glycosyltransferase family 39 protein [Planctomycetota bacterium]